MLFLEQLFDYDGNMMANVVKANRVIEMVNMFDIYSEVYREYKYYALPECGKIIPLDYTGWQRNCKIEMKDKDGNVWLCGYGEDH